MAPSIDDWSFSEAEIMRAESPPLQLDQMSHHHPPEPPDTVGSPEDDASLADGEGRSSVMLKYAEEIRDAQKGDRDDASTTSEVHDREEAGGLEPQRERVPDPSVAGNTTTNSKEDSFLRFSFEGFKFVDGHVVRDGSLSTDQEPQARAASSSRPTTSQSQELQAKEHPTEEASRSVVKEAVSRIERCSSEPPSQVAKGVELRAESPSPGRSPGQTPKRTSPQTPPRTPERSSRRTPEWSPQQSPDQSLHQSSHQSPDQLPQQSPAPSTHSERHSISRVEGRPSEASPASTADADLAGASNEADASELSYITDDECNSSGDLGGPTDFTEKMLEYMTGQLEYNPTEQAIRHPPAPTVEDAAGAEDEEPVEAEVGVQPAAEPQKENEIEPEHAITAESKATDPGAEMMAAIIEETKRLTEMRISDETEKALLRAELDAQRKEIERLQFDAEKNWRDQSLIAADEEERHRQELQDRELEVASLRQYIEQLQEEFSKARDLQILANAEEKDRHFRDLQAKVMQVAALKKDLRQVQGVVDQFRREHVTILTEERERHQTALQAKQMELEGLRKELGESVAVGEKTVDAPEKAVGDDKCRCGYEEESAKQAAEIVALQGKLQQFQACAEKSREDDKSTAVVDMEGHRREMELKDAEIAKMNEEVKHLRTEFESQRKNITEKNSELQRLRGELENAQEEAEKTQQARLVLAKEEEGRQEEIRLKGKEITALKKHVERLQEVQAAKLAEEEAEKRVEEVEAQETKKEMDRLRAALANSVPRDELERCKAELEAKSIEIGELEKEIEGLHEARLRDEQEEPQCHDTELKEKDTEILGLKDRLKRLMAEAEKAEQAHQVSLTEEQERYQEKLQRKDLRINGLRYDLKHLQATFERAEYQQIVLAGEETNRHRQILAGQATQIAELKRQVKRLQSEDGASKRHSPAQIEEIVQRAVAEALKASHDKHSRDTGALKEQLRVSQKARMAMKAAHEEDSSELEARYAAAIDARDQSWSGKYDVLKKERDLMAKVLMHQWGKEDLGGTQPQVFKYKHARKST